MGKYVVPTALFLSLVLVSIVYAGDTSLGGGFDLTGQQRDAKASLYQGSFRSTVRDINEANKVGFILSEETAKLMSTAELISKGRATQEIAVAKHKESTRKQNAFADEVEAQIVSYRAICIGPPVPQSTYDWCMREKVRVNSLVSQVNRSSNESRENKDRLIKNEGLLDEASAQLKKSADALKPKVEAYFDKHIMLVQRAKDFLEKLKQLQTGYDACKNAQGSLEKVHEICGTMFDGNIVHETETNHPIPDPTFK
jgi:hypothetical protein